MKNHITFKLIFSVIVCVFILSAGCSSDNPVVPPKSITELHTNGTFVPTSHSQIQGVMFITDQNGNTVSGIAASNVSARLSWGSNNPLDSGVGGVITISQNNQSSTNIAAALTMDYSGSMGQQQKYCMQNACTTYVDKMISSDQTEIIKFSTAVEVVQPFTNNKTVLNNSILSSWSGTGGSTALYQAIYQATGDIIQQPQNQFTRAVIAFTDGEENASSINRSQMINYALSNGIPIYTVGLLYNLSSNGAKDLENIADTSGAFYFHSNPDSCTHLSDIYATISGQLAGAYSLTVNWQGTLPSSGTTVTAKITTTYQNLTSYFNRAYVIP
jgi:hypothetical protein